MANCCGDKSLRRQVRSSGDVRPPKQTQDDVKRLLAKAYDPNTNKRCPDCGKLMHVVVGFKAGTNETSIKRTCPACGRVIDVSG